MSDGKRESDELRQEQSKLDAQIVAALDRRARISRRLGELRRLESSPQLVAGRSMVPPPALVRGNGDMPEETVEAVFREVTAACLALELPQKIVFFGQEGSQADMATRSRFGQTANLVALETTQQAIDEVTRKRADFAVIPLETKSDGLVQTTIFQLAASELKIVAVIESAATLHLLNRTGNVADIEKIYTTADDHARCQRFLAAHPTRVSVVDVKSPLVACQVALEDHGAAALAFEEFAAPMGLQVARRHVADDAADRTRYAVVGMRPSGRSEEDVTDIVFNVQDSPGALLEVLRQLSERGINLLRIQSHPAMGPGWSYLFFVEVTGHATDRSLVTAFEDVKRQTKFFKVLGSYSTTQ